jgi:hypothetical protein
MPYRFFVPFISFFTPGMAAAFCLFVILYCTAVLKKKKAVLYSHYVLFGY